MKTKQKISLLILVIVIAVTAILLVWYFSPRNFLEGVELSDINSIIVFDGNTGKGFDILAADEIRYIVENIQGNKMERDGVSIGYMGWSFQMIFCDEAGKPMESFVINSVNTIRKDPFFYRCDGDLCFDYLKELEAKYSH